MHYNYFVHRIGISSRCFYEYRLNTHKSLTFAMLFKRRMIIVLNSIKMQATAPLKYSVERGATTTGFTRRIQSSGLSRREMIRRVGKKIKTNYTWLLFKAKTYRRQYTCFAKCDTYLNIPTVFQLSCIISERF